MTFSFYENNLYKTSLFQHLIRCLPVILFCLLVNIAPTLAQEEEEPTEEKKGKKAKAPKSYGDYVALVNEVSKMTREEKNTMSQCPLHGKEMLMSDNYRANASDYTTCYEYPFAYQLNYRRYCKTCTKIMAKESGESMPVITKATFERCGLHNTTLKGNPDYSSTEYERNPSSSTPHARQYWFRNYCTACTKIFKQNSK